MSAPQSVGSAVRPRASLGNLSLGEITTPADHENDPASTANSASTLEPFTDSSTPVSAATPATPKPKPSALSGLIFCCPIDHASTRMNMGSVAMSRAASPEPTYCSAQ